MLVPGTTIDTLKYLLMRSNLFVIARETNLSASTLGRILAGEKVSPESEYKIFILFVQKKLKKA